MKSKTYTGVGSRETPEEIMQLMERIAYKLAKDGYTLRSGGAEGADTAFYQGFLKWKRSVSVEDWYTMAEIYIPWKRFGSAWPDDAVLVERMDMVQAAIDIVSKLHPAWSAINPKTKKPVLSTAAKQLHTRNVFQVLGGDLDLPSDFLICWAKTDYRGIPKGGTRTAWVIARQYGVQCFNLANPEDLQRILKWLEK